jgi:excisionase family DNA binding protein
MPRVMTVEQAAEYLQLTTDTVRRGARTGRIPAARVGRRWRFLQPELDTWLSAGGDRSECELDAWLVRESDTALGGERLTDEQVKAKLGL